MILKDQEKEKDKEYFKIYRGFLLQISDTTNTIIELRDTEGNILIESRREGRGQREQRAESRGLGGDDGLRDIIEKMKVTGRKRVQGYYNGINAIGLSLGEISDTSSMVLIAYRQGDNKGHKKGFDLKTVKLLEEVTRTISEGYSNHLEINSMAQELSMRYEELNMVYDIGRRMDRFEYPMNNIALIVRDLKEIIGSDIVWVSIPTKGIDEFVVNNNNPLPMKIEELKDKVGRIISILLEKEADKIVTDDIRKYSHLEGYFPIPIDVIGIPIMVKYSMAGFLCTMNIDSAKRFTTGDVRMTETIAEQISSIITTIELYQNLRDFLLSVIKALVATLEAKDEYTRGHSERVNKLSVSIAEAMRLGTEEIEDIKWASILHDIGKIAVPEEILTKPSHLSDKEYISVMIHPKKGYEILKPIKQLKGALDGIYHHHERFDGTGYPFGLKGKDIPLSARVIAVADAYDAMTSSRAYRPAISSKECINELIKAKGTQLDPEIVDLFMRLI
ncbi:MAG: HD domain-containing protein [Nitrospinae bacterium]|nr:HD domain-containing protein [Nitrospinota bacterium]